VVVKFDTQFLDINTTVEELRKIDPEVIIIALLKEETPSLLREINRLGIYAYLAEPIKEEELFFLINKGEELHKLAHIQHKLTDGLKEQNASLQKQNSLLAKRLEESTKNLTRLYEDLRSTYMRTIKALAQTIDARDHYTHSHSENVAKYSVAIAEELHLPAKDIEIIREACELHDLGKIGIPDSILVKPAALTLDEWKIMKRHPITGAEILEPLTFLHSVIDLIRQHHEHYDGTGYPKGLKADQITLGARIIHLADAYEAMTSPRSYRKNPFSKKEAIEEIKKHKGTQFDPQIVDVFLKVVDSF
jgi:putative nucleotidyltransferase with HDIG domain